MSSWVIGHMHPKSYSSVFKKFKSSNENTSLKTNPTHNFLEQKNKQLGFWTLLNFSCIHFFTLSVVFYPSTKARPVYIHHHFACSGHEVRHQPKTLHETRREIPQKYLYHLENRWRNSHVLVYHGPLLSHLLGVVSHLLGVASHLLSLRFIREILQKYHTFASSLIPPKNGWHLKTPVIKGILATPPQSYPFQE